MENIPVWKSIHITPSNYTLKNSNLHRYLSVVCASQFINLNLLQRGLKAECFKITSDVWFADNWAETIRTGYIICRSRSKMKMWGPCSKIINNFKMIITVPWTKCGALLGTSPVQLPESHAHDAGPGNNPRAVTQVAETSPTFPLPCLSLLSFSFGYLL